MLFLAYFLTLVEGSYLPGTVQNKFYKDNKIDLYVEKVDSSLTQLPYDYYYLGYCNAKDLEGKNSQEVEKDENIGQELAGDILKNSHYKIEMKKEEKKI